MIPVGRILKSNGTDGAVLAGFYDAMENYQEPLYIYYDGLAVPFFIEDSSSKGGRMILHLSGIYSLDDAEEIVGREIYSDSQSEEADEENFIGWEVFDKGRRLGEITGDEPIPGNYCVYVGKILIPLHEDFILSADPEAKVLKLDLPEGLY